MVLFDWLHQRIGLAWSVDFKAIGRVVNGELVGVVGYNNHTGSSCQIHMAGDHKHWITPTLLRTAFHLPFNNWGYQVLFGAVPSGNQEALDIDLRLGFTTMATVPGAHPDGALHMLMMRREDCRWIVRR